MIHELTGSFIDGRTRASSCDRNVLINPATEETFHELADAGRADVAEAAASADRAWRNEWRDLAPGKRSDALFRFAELIEKNADLLAELDSRSMGKPLTAARGEVISGARTFRYYAGAVGYPTGEVIPVSRGGFDFTLRQPLGVVACIVPWNFPFAIACWKVAPALAAGNAVLLKPAAPSPLGALALGRLALEAGIPEGILQVIAGPGAELGDALVTDRHVRKVSFTGSTEVGRHVMRTAAQDFKRVSLELGGKSPNIVFADSDWEKAADTSPYAVFDNTGQDCCARSRIFVEAKIHDEFVERFIAASQRLRVGAPESAETELGPLVTKGRRESVEEYVADAKALGREIRCGGERVRDRGYYYAPTVITDVKTTDRCWTEEIFGPVACVRSFTNEDAMLAEVNASPYGLSASVWTRDLERALRVSRRVESGVVSINCHNSVHIEAPFGGYKHSGIGRDLGLAALDGFTETKNIYIDA
ncbi:MAG: aldehyde dehydrogenase family protein [Chthoniobacteraceae bacterium]